MNATGTITVEAVGFEELKKEVKNGVLRNHIQGISAAVCSELKDTLWRHVKEDIYHEYSPKEYLRRKDHPKFGTSLLQSAEDAEPLGEGGFYLNGEWIAGIRYEPSTEHKISRWSDGISSNELIGRIEKKEPAYNWEPKNGPKIPERPFWQNFVEEMIEGGGFERVLERELKKRKIAEPDDLITGVVRESEDGIY